MNSNLYVLGYPDNIDSLDLDSLRRRLDASIQLAQDWVAGDSLTEPDPSPSSVHALPDLNRHTTYYGPGGEWPPARDRHSLSTQLAFHKQSGRDRLTISLPAAFDRLALTIHEPAATSGFNHLKPYALTADIVATLTRWRGWLDHFILPIASPDRQALDADFAASSAALFELLRTHGFNDGPAITGFYNWDLSAPFAPPQVTLHGDGVSPNGKHHACLSPAGQAVAEQVLPTIIRMKVIRTAGGYTLSFRPALFEALWMPDKPALLDQMRSLSKLPDCGDEPLVQPLLRLAA